VNGCTRAQKGPPASPIATRGGRPARPPGAMIDGQGVIGLGRAADRSDTARHDPSGRQVSWACQVALLTL